MSLGVGLLVCVVVAMGFAALVAGEHLPESSLGYGALSAVFLGAVMAAFISGMKIRMLRLPVCLGAGAVFLLALILCGWLFFGQIRGGILPTGALCLGGGMLVGILGRKGSGKPKYKVPKMRF